MLRLSRWGFLRQWGCSPLPTTGDVDHQENDEYMEGTPLSLFISHFSFKDPERNTFIPMFVVKRSDYRDGQASFVVTNQESILSSYCEDDDVRDYMDVEVGVECPDPCAIHPQNPCHYGHIFSGLELSGTVFLESVKIYPPPPPICVCVSVCKREISRLLHLCCCLPASAHIFTCRQLYEF